MTNPVVTDALIVSLKTVAIAQVVILGFGTPTAWFLASHRFKGRSLAVTLVELPIVLPPAVAGIGLLVAFGRFGLLGSTFDFLGINVVVQPDRGRDGDHARRRARSTCARRSRRSRPSTGT